MIEIVENKVVRRSETLTEVTSTEIINEIKSIDDSIINLQFSKSELEKELDLILELEKELNEKGNRKK